MVKEEGMSYCCYCVIDDGVDAVAAEDAGAGRGDEEGCFGGRVVTTN